MTEKVLFVDDEENILHSIKRELRKRFEIYTAESGADALEILKDSGPFAVIVSDMRMPVMSGLEALQVLSRSGNSHRGGEQGPDLPLSE